MKPALWLVAFTFFVPPGKVVNFDGSQLGQMPAGWTAGMSGWEIRRDQSAPTQPNVFAQIATNSKDRRSPLAILDGPLLSDLDISVRLKPVSGRNGISGGVVWRYRDENNYCAARANAIDNTVSVFKVENGRHIELTDAVKRPIPANSWSILKISVRGSRVQVFVDHRRVLDGQDGAPSRAGKVGLWTVANSVVYFDDFRLYPK